MKRVLLLAALAACEAPHGTVLWHGYTGAERAALETTAATWNAQHPDQPVELVAVPFGALADKLTSAIPNGNGPDLFIYPQDRIGDWADSAIVEPIEFYVDDAAADHFTPDSLAAMAYRGSLYGLPVAEKSLAFFYRTDLVPTPPKTTDELLALAPLMKAKDGYAVLYTNDNLFGHAPWLHGFGGRVLDDHDQLAIATPEAAAAMTFARQLVTAGAIPAQVDGAQVATLFNAGKAATAISGPWFIGDIAEGVPWAVTALPVVSATGKYATPFYGADGVLMSSHAHDKDAAFAVMAGLTSDDAALVRAKSARQLVPNLAAIHDPAIANDPVMAGLRGQLAHTVQMSGTPAMRMVWTPYETALGEVLTGRAQPADQLLAIEREVAGYVSGRAEKR